MMIFCIAIALAIAIALSIVLGVTIVILNKELRSYKTATCLSMGKLGRLYRMPAAANLKQNLWFIWRATEVYVPKDDLDVISDCFYKE